MFNASLVIDQRLYDKGGRILERIKAHGILFKVPLTRKIFISVNEAVP